MKSFGALDHILIEGQNKVVLWDNNIFGVPGWESIIDEIRQRNLYVDFNQAMDARLITPRVAEKLRGLKIRPIRMAYDVPSAGPAVVRAADLLEEVGFRRDRMIVYTMFNFRETPEDFFHRIQELLSIGVVAYPMRYEPLDSLNGLGVFILFNQRLGLLQQGSHGTFVLGVEGNPGDRVVEMVDDPDGDAIEVVHVMLELGHAQFLPGLRHPGLHGGNTNCFPQIPQIF